MTDPVTIAASSALAELLEVSPQVDAAVILERDGGRVVASSPGTTGRMAEQLGATCVRIVDAAEQSRRELGREPVAQVEVGSPDGHVFVVGDATWIVAAVTDADPTVGLVFYDLKTALRAVREARATATGSGNGAVQVVRTSDAAGDETTPAATASSIESGDRTSNQRWRRRNKK